VAPPSRTLRYSRSRRFTQGLNLRVYPLIELRLPQSFTEPRRRSGGPWSEDPDPSGSSHGILFPYDARGEAERPIRSFAFSGFAALSGFLTLSALCSPPSRPTLFHAGGVHGVLPSEPSPLKGPCRLSATSALLTFTAHPPCCMLRSSHTIRAEARRSLPSAFRSSRSVPVVSRSPDAGEASHRCVRRRGPKPTSRSAAALEPSVRLVVPGAGPAGACLASGAVWRRPVADRSPHPGACALGFGTRLGPGLAPRVVGGRGSRTSRAASVTLGLPAGAEAPAASPPDRCWSRPRCCAAEAGGPRPTALRRCSHRTLGRLPGACFPPPRAGARRGAGARLVPACRPRRCGPVPTPGRSPSPVLARVAEP
jgi:hypothetical protein